jgi:hypothetical protein
VVTDRVRQQLADAPPILLGYVAGITAILRVDPTTASTVFQIRRVDDAAWTVTFAAGRGFLTYSEAFLNSSTVGLERAR